MLLWIQSFYSGSTVKLLLPIESFYSGSKVITLDPRLLLRIRIQSFSGSYIRYYTVYKVFTVDSKSSFRIQCSYSRSKVFTSDPKIRSTLIFRNHRQPKRTICGFGLQRSFGRNILELLVYYLMPNKCKKS